MYFVLRRVYYFFFFFFQAEDGIRDLIVTGVQTCALPILRTEFLFLLRRAATDDPGTGTRFAAGRSPPLRCARPTAPRRATRGLQTPRCEIGRASCRERV